MGHIYIYCNGDLLLDGPYVCNAISRTYGPIADPFATCHIPLSKYPPLLSFHTPPIHLAILITKYNLWGFVPGGKMGNQTPISEKSNLHPIFHQGMHRS